MTSTILEPQRGTKLSKSDMVARYDAVFRALKVRFESNERCPFQEQVRLLATYIDDKII